MSLKLSYVTLYPEKYPRVKKITVALKSEDVHFRALAPRVLVKLGNGIIQRVISAAINYSAYLLQIFFSKADVYWVASSPDIFALPLIIKKADYILEYRSPWSLEVEHEFGKGMLSRLAAFLTREAIKNAKIITVPSRTLKKDLSQYDKKVFLIPNYPLKKNFRPSVKSDEFRKQNGAGKGQKIILFTGRLSTVEGINQLDGIMSKLVRNRKDIVLWIVGDGPLKAQAEDLVAKFPENVKFFGWQRHEEIPNFVNAADVCILPRNTTAFSSYYNEEGVQKIGEYMLFGKPIVASGAAPSKEYLLVEPEDMADGILRALEGKVPKPTPRTWEDDCQRKVLEVVDFARKLRNPI